MFNDQAGGNVLRERTLVLDGLIFELTHTTDEDIERIYAARYRNLGLTAYGESEADAEKNLELLLRKFVTTLIQNGTLASRLASVGVRWYWEEDPSGWETVIHNGPKRGETTGRVLVNA